MLRGDQLTTDEKLINSIDWDEIKEWLALEDRKGLSIDVNDARLRIAYHHAKMHDSYTKMFSISYQYNF